MSQVIPNVHRVALCVGIVLGFLQVPACDEECAQDLLDDGDYVVREVHGGLDDVNPEWEFLIGAEIHVERAARLLTIRYELDGSTYEVRYTLTP